MTRTAYYAKVREALERAAIDRERFETPEFQRLAEINHALRVLLDEWATRSAELRRFDSTVQKLAQKIDRDVPPRVDEALAYADIMTIANKVEQLHQGLLREAAYTADNEKELTDNHEAIGTKVATLRLISEESTKLQQRNAELVAEVERLRKWDPGKP